MIDADFCRVMARYNRWQNAQLLKSLEPLSAEELGKDRGAFFGSILATANHVLWGDLMWMSRIEGGAAPEGGIDASTTRHLTLASWSAERFRVDARIVHWADHLDNVAIKGNLSFYSGMLGRDVTKPLDRCITHMFNHQTHHRGQIHAMITSLGAKAPVSDLFVMPEDA
jgi:uncharacterized damage-inducible protein DinB